MKPIQIALSIALCLSLASCITRVVPAEEVVWGVEQVFAPDADSAADADTLLTHEGGVVPEQLSGTVEQGGATRHEIEPSGEGRMYIVELYQQAIDERDRLLIEVEDLEAVVGGLEQEVESARAENAARALHTAELESTIARLQEESLDLAARLATAQVRRLEAEKLLVEAKLRWLGAEGHPVARPAQVSPASKAPAAPASSWDLALEEGL